MPVSSPRAIAWVGLLALLVLASCRTDGATWSRYEGTVTSTSPDVSASARLTVSTVGDTAFEGYIEIGRPLAHDAGGVWGWYLADSIAFMTLSVLQDTILWTAAHPTDTAERLDGTFEIIGGRRMGERGTWTATLKRGTPLYPRASSVPVSPGASDPIAWLALALGLLALSIATGWAIQPVEETRVDQATLDPGDAQLNGVGGWMAWFLIGQAATIIMAAVKLPSAYSPYLDGTWEMGQVFPAFQQMITLELLMACTQIAAPALGMILTLRKDPRAPRIWFVYLGAMMIYSIVEVAGWLQLKAALADSFGQAAADEGSKEIAADMRRTVRYIVWAPVWMTYWNVSRRVRVTFGRGALGARPEPSTTSLVPRRIARPAAESPPSGGPPAVTPPASGIDQPTPDIPRP